MDVEIGIIRPTFEVIPICGIRRCENSDISPAYASVSSMMKVLSDMINESGNNLDDMPEQKVWLLNAAKDILDNSGKLGVRLKVMILRQVTVMDMNKALSYGEW